MSSSLQCQRETETQAGSVIKSIEFKSSSNLQNGGRYLVGTLSLFFHNFNFSLATINRGILIYAELVKKCTQQLYNNGVNSAQF